MKALSPREMQIVELLVGGLTQKEVACRLGIRPGTVRGYLKRVQTKTEKPTIIAAIVFTLKHGLVLVNSA
jgi:DNA-binding CsgD family transcriptional regulator